uniref:Uncharacterized protein n=1 Tax=Tanacetum cinerariifolium TaxID=118510 RepID=A0A699GTA5_TANCI|nr:hypothetical protein [Tanacetum cinerariifolium]
MEKGFLCAKGRGSGSGVKEKQNSIFVDSNIECVNEGIGSPSTMNVNEESGSNTSNGTNTDGCAGLANNLNMNPTPTIVASTPFNLFAALLKGDTSRKSVNFPTLVTLADNGADFVVSKESVCVVNERLNNIVYGFFLGNHFSSKDEMKFMLENGLWLIRNVSLILRKWTPDANIITEDVCNIPVWVKFQDIPIIVFTDDGLSDITTELGKPLIQGVSNSNPFDTLNSVENDDNLVTNAKNSKLAEKGVNSGVVSYAHGSSPVASDVVEDSLRVEDYQLNNMVVDNNMRVYANQDVNYMEVDSSVGVEESQAEVNDMVVKDSVMVDKIYDDVASTDRMDDDSYDAIYVYERSNLIILSSDSSTNEDKSIKDDYAIDISYSPKSKSVGNNLPVGKKVSHKVIKNKNAEDTNDLSYTPKSYVPIGKKANKK